jgi:hypothetical protein
MKLVSQIDLALRDYLLLQSSSLLKIVEAALLQSVFGATWSLPFQSVALPSFDKPRICLGCACLEHKQHFFPVLDTQLFLKEAAVAGDLQKVLHIG